MSDVTVIDTDDRRIVRRAVVHAPQEMLALLPDVEADLRASGLIQQLDTAVETTNPGSPSHE